MTTAVTTRPATGAKPATGGKRPRRPKGLSPHLFLVLAVVISVFPFVWTIVMATNTTRDIYKSPPKLTPGSHLLENIRGVLDTVDFFGSMLNTVVIACATTVLVLLVDSLAAFAFAKFEFPGRKLLFGLLLVFMMLPLQLAVLPQFILMSELGWVGMLKALVWPALSNAFGIFWLRQYIETGVPDELLDAARIDGAGFFRQYWNVALPMIRPAMSFLAIYAFVGAWNDYVWPLIVLTNPDHVTLQVELAQLNVGHNTDYSMVMAGVLMASLPLVIVFAVFARGFIAGATEGAVQGS
ncbi:MULTISPECIES: carbohydrate ABC transporter permease [Streptomyces]|uniref:Carbohydrate ABC transporter permease n=1 Tax=Streptomyces caniscabiei TaxID=2746961 RepID=A0ABU4N1R9_9ACTN|nr:MULTISPECIES: carbohydrate ABC transporter permease [Streptomyces]MBE4756524.1 carbohydrate ABC transporter permease [Streptomyces caniscabiei]MBE4768971.1 carbohydrate ABC transporter permease [Streptomyces caniscabiei]MBE4782895.1 carbohydrate ABC transporter permease [Streptomyces caniscabiei]MBE4792198.1 carbohydrate ABC transporter permease [Streptomyces caniscabiei]MDX2944917.1 carbohydrate ABC transporter permease [Streptomyces caniscabiei]